MTKLEDLKKRIEVNEKRNQESRRSDPKERSDSVDMTKVDKIVDRMKQKYADQGIDTKPMKGQLGELRGIIEDNEQAKVNLQPVEDLKEFRSPLVKAVGNFYILFRKVLEPINTKIKKLALARDIRYYLYSANMKFSLNQWLALTISAAAISAILVFAITVAVSIATDISPIIILVLPIITFIFAILVMVLIPKFKAGQRASEISVELPFALRHMATELKAGIGLYKTVQTIATADYGVLSEEFARTVSEIEEGTDSKEALRHFAMRTQSRALRTALMHVVRALKTGGNLSEIMSIIAEEVSFNMRTKIRDYAEKMNFFGVVFIFGAIVIPVFIAILGSIMNAPVSLGNISMPPLMIAMFFTLAMPMALGMLVFYLKMTQPRA